MSVRKYCRASVLFALLINLGVVTNYTDAKGELLVTGDRFENIQSDHVSVKRLIGVWDLTKVDGKPATDIFTTEFRVNGTYSVTTVSCSEESGTWSASRKTITATVTHSPKCVKNVGKRYSDRFSLYGKILIVHILDEKRKEHAYTFRKRTSFLNA